MIISRRMFGTFLVSNGWN